MNTSVANLVNSVTGNVSKGYLMLGKNLTRPDEPKASNEGSGASKNKFMKAVDKVSSVESAALNKAKSALQKTPLMSMDSNVLDQSNSGMYNVLEVQYNPESITMNTVRGNILNRSAGGTGENVYQQLNVTARTTLSVDLIFDQMNIFDAFNFENVVTVAGMKDYAKRSASEISGDSYTVRPYVEALVGAMVKKETRYAVFVWNHMAFNGELTGVNAEYTMFNRTGEPIRAKVGLQIFHQNRQYATNKQNESVEISNKYWEDAYKRLFMGSRSGGAVDALDGLNKVSNFINL